MDMSKLAGLKEPERTAAITKLFVAKYNAEKAQHLGPYLIGFAIDWLLFGVFLVQLVHWGTYAREDKTIVKGLVICSTLACMAGLGFLTTYMYRIYVLYYGDFTVLLPFSWVVNYIVISVFGTVFVQIFYVERAYRLTKSVLIPILAVGGILVVTGVTIWSRIKAVRYPSLLQANLYTKELYLWLGGTLFVDLLLTSSIAYGLWRQRTGWTDTNRLIVRLIRVTFEAQVPPTVLALIMMIIYGSSPTSSWIHSLGSFQLQVYANGMLAVLNSRTKLRKGSRSQISDVSGGKEITFGATSNRHQHATVMVTTDTHTESYKMDPLHEPPRSINRSPFVDNSTNKDEAHTGHVLNYEINDSRTALTDGSKSMV